MEELTMDEPTKEHNLEILNEIVKEAKMAILNLYSNDIEEVQQNFIQIESLSQDFEI